MQQILKKRAVLRNNTIAEADDSEVDYEFTSPNQYMGSHTNAIPLMSAVAGPRVFYGARFQNQAMPTVNREAPLVQTLADDDPEGRSFDEIYGDKMGAIRAKLDGVVTKVEPSHIEIKGPDGKKSKVALYQAFPLNRKTAISSVPKVKAGDTVKTGQLLAGSNYTDDNGVAAVGSNAKIALLPYKGYSMDDAVVISEGFAKKLAQQALYGFDTDYKRGVEGGKARHMGLFPNKFTTKQLELLDDDGVIRPGMTVNAGDPLILATRPKVISSQQAQLGRLSSHMKSARSDASTVWQEDEPGVVKDVKKLRSGVKVNVEVIQPTKVGDKLSLRSGQKTTVSLILPDAHIPRVADTGEPMDMLLNHLGMPSRVNNSLAYELLLGKAAAKRGKPYKLPSFTKPDEKWYDIVERELAAEGLNKTEKLYDPKDNRLLENPVTVGVGHVLKLHHTSGSKVSYRGQGSYDKNEQPAKGGSEAAQSKRLSGLEVGALMSSGAYGVIRDMATVRGQRNDEYWRRVREGHAPVNPGVPFAFNKFRALLSGAGMKMRDQGDGRERLTFWTDNDLDRVKPVEVTKSDLVDPETLEPVPGGLFDDALTGVNAWGAITLPHAYPNPAAETVILKLLGLTQKQYRAILAGEEPLPQHLVK